MKTVKIIGAGLNGLLSAFYLDEKGLKVEIYEKNNYVGGKVQTLTTSHGLRETAANAVIADAEIERVAKLIGVELTASRQEARRRWIFRQGLKRWPLGIIATVNFFIFLIKWGFKFKSVQPLKMETLRCWGERVLGAEAVQYLIEPGCLGIFGAPTRELSATLILNYFFGSKRPRGRLRGSVAPVGGMGEFAKKLKMYLEKRGVSFIFQEDVSPLLQGDVVIATDLPSAIPLLEKWQDPRASVLSQVPHVDLISVNAYFEKSHQFPLGFGVLFPRDRGITPLGVLFNGSIFEHMMGKNCHSETWIFGGPHPSEVSTWSDDSLRENLLKTRAQVFKTTDSLIESFVNRWPLGIPLYGLALEKALLDLPTGNSQIHLMGNYLGEIGIGRFFHQARSLAEKLS